MQRTGKLQFRKTRPRVKEETIEPIGNREEWNDPIRGLPTDVAMKDSLFGAPTAPAEAGKPAAKKREWYDDDALLDPLDVRYVATEDTKYTRYAFKDSRADEQMPHARNRSVRLTERPARHQKSKLTDARRSRELLDVRVNDSREIYSLVRSDRHAVILAAKEGCGDDYLSSYRAIGLNLGVTKQRVGQLLAESVADITAGAEALVEERWVRDPCPTAALHQELAYSLRRTLAALGYEVEWSSEAPEATWKPATDI